MVTVRLQCVSKISGILTGFLIKMSEVLFTFVCVFCQLGILCDVGHLLEIVFVISVKKLFLKENLNYLLLKEITFWRWEGRRGGGGWGVRHKIDLSLIFK